MGSGKAVLGSGTGPVSTAKDGVEVGGKEEVERPAAGSIYSFAIVLVNGVEVRALFAIDDDGDEGRVQKGGNGVVGEGILSCKATVWIRKMVSKKPQSKPPDIVATEGQQGKKTKTYDGRLRSQCA